MKIALHWASRHSHSILSGLVKPSLIQCLIVFIDFVPTHIDENVCLSAERVLRRNVVQ